MHPLIQIVNKIKYNKNRLPQHDLEQDINYNRQSNFINTRDSTEFLGWCDNSGLHICFRQEKEVFFLLFLSLFSNKQLRGVNYQFHSSWNPETQHGPRRYPKIYTICTKLEIFMHFVCQTIYRCQN